MSSDDFEDGSSERTIVGERLPAVTDLKGSSEEAYVIVIAGPNVGEMFKVGTGGDIGRGGDVEFRLTDTEISRRHARIVRRGGDVLVEDLNSTNGTFVNGDQVETQRLNDGDKIQVGTTTILKFSYHDDLEEQFQRKMYESALRDGLTKAFNKKYFEERLQSEVAFALRHGTALSLLMLDLDHFKEVNDTYGHLAGDYILSTFASSILTTVRKEDVFARYGGEEFALISRGLDEEVARHFGERVRRSVERYPFRFQGHEIAVTVSVGIAGLPTAPVTDHLGLVAAADKALYEAKHRGRNRVCVFGQ
jgi:two-component system, cell cycle response regulator